MLHIHRSHRTEALVERLAALYADPLPDPMQADWLLVGSPGMEGWVVGELARRSPHGVAANIEASFPSAFVERLADDVLGEAPPGAVDPWSAAALSWTLAGRIPDAIADDEAAFAPVAGYLGVQPRDTDEAVDDGTGQLAFAVDTTAVASGFVVDRRLLGFAAQTADLFDRYALHRPTMVRAWRTGRDVGPEPASDPAPLPEDQRWQAALWRAVAAEQRAVEAVPDRVAAAVAALTGTSAPSPAVPERLAAFGVSTLPPLQLELLAAVARHREVHLFVPSASPRLWQLGWDEDPATQPGNALLRAAGPVGRHAATLVRVAAEAVDVTLQHHEPTAPPSPATLLERLQHDLVTDTPLPATSADGVTPVSLGDDRSVVFHDGHGAVRQVEALREELLRRFDDDPTLQPRDVVVLTPDVATYAPLVRAVFADPRGRRWPDGRPHGDEPPTIPVAVAGRTAGSGNAVATVLGRALALVHARTSGAEVLDLLSSEPVRTRFRLTPRELLTVQRWIEDTGVAWGRDEADRRAQQQPPRRDHTWAAAVDRWLTGVAMADEGARTIGGVVPYDGIEDSTDLDLLDRVLQALDVVDDLVRLRTPRSLDEWADELALLLDRLTGPADGLPWMDRGERDAHQRLRARVDGVLARLRRAHDAMGRDVDVGALERWLEAELARAGGSGAGHGTGSVTVAELVPLRAIPFRVVCLLGMDTGAFPRRSTPPSHDLTARHPRPGDRDRAAEDRAAFTDALLAARDALVVTYAGRDPRTGHEQPPAIPVAELRDAVEALVGRDGLDELTTEHPVLPTGPEAFLVAEPGAEPASYDTVRLAAARAGLTPPAPVPPFVATALAPDEDGPVDARLDVDRLANVVAKPAQTLLQRLRVARPDDLRTFPETEPLELDALQRWQLGTQLLAELEAVDPDDDDAFDRLLTAALARGRIPADGLGRFAVFGIRTVVARMLQLLDVLGPDRSDVGVTASVDGRTIEGAVRTVRGDRLQLVETWYGAADGKRYLRAWLRHLVASIALADEQPRTVLLHRQQADVLADVYLPVAPDRAAVELQRWLDVHDRAAREAVPFVAKVSWIHARARREAERIAARAHGVDLADVEGLTDQELCDQHGATKDGRRTVAGVLSKGTRDARDAWGTGENDRFPVREHDDIAIVFRHLQRWEDLVRVTPMLSDGRDLLRLLADAVHEGRAQADALLAAAP